MAYPELSEDDWKRFFREQRTVDQRTIDCGLRKFLAISISSRNSFLITEHLFSLNLNLVTSTVDTFSLSLCGIDEDLTSNNDPENPVPHESSED